jgi:hypothetical protein
MSTAQINENNCSGGSDFVAMSGAMLLPPIVAAVGGVKQ